VYGNSRGSDARPPYRDLGRLESKVRHLSDTKTVDKGAAHSFAVAEPQIEKAGDESN
jgi:hypothetical protein